MNRRRRRWPAVSATTLVCATAIGTGAGRSNDASVTVQAFERRSALAMNTPGFLASWDFVTREPDGSGRFIARTPVRAANDFALDAGSWIGGVAVFNRVPTDAELSRLSGITAEGPIAARRDRP